MNRYERWKRDNPVIVVQPVPQPNGDLALNYEQALLWLTQSGQPVEWLIHHSWLSPNYGDSDARLVALSNGDYYAVTGRVSRAKGYV